MFMCICACVYVYVYAYVYTYIKEIFDLYVLICLLINTRSHILLHKNIYVRVHAYTHVLVCVYAYEYARKCSREKKIHTSRRSCVRRASTRLLRSCSSQMLASDGIYHRSAFNFSGKLVKSSLLPKKTAANVLQSQHYRPFTW